jgi:hypothetical protein
MNSKLDSMSGIQKKFKGSKKLFPNFFSYGNTITINIDQKIIYLDKFGFLIYTSI